MHGGTLVPGLAALVAAKIAAADAAAQTSDATDSATAPGVDDVPVATPDRAFLALGDSYTIGEAAPVEARWTMQLTRLLAADGIDLGEAPQTIATTGWTTDELALAIAAEDAAGRLRRDYALVSLLIGVNNQYRGRDVASFAPEYAALLEQAIACAGGRPARVLALSIPDWGRTPFGAASGRDLDTISSELDAYNAESARQCAARGVAFVDITGHSRAAGDGEGMVADDGLHPGAAAYAAWTERAAPVAARLLRGD